MPQFSIRNIFRGSQNITPQPVNDGNTAPTHSSIRENETFVDYGKRLCGIANGNSDVLPVFFQKVIESEKNRYLQDEKRLQEDNNKTTSLIEKKRAEKEVQDNNLNSTTKQIEEIEEAIQSKKGEISVLETGDNSGNREMTVKFYFGLLIIVLLSIYLFVFYSSTFYSAFFGEDVADVSDAMFNTKALYNAFGLGFGSALFVCTAPVIFMALGYALHYFSMQKGWGKYFKVAGCIFVTFLFDCLLAYSIAAKCYVPTAPDFEPFNMSTAIEDVNVWIVIFCGFVTYMIWGIVLDMVISAYGDFRYNSTSIEKLKNEIAALQHRKENLQAKVTEIRNVISRIKAELRTLENSRNTVNIPISVLSEAVSDFYAGWTAVVSVLAPTGYNPAAAQQHYDNCINNINSTELRP